MAEKCKECGDSGVSIEPYGETGNMFGPFFKVFHCTCGRCKTIEDAYARVHACCNAHDALVAACKVCEQSITELVEAEQPTSVDWINVRAARHLARAALAKAKPETNDV